MYKILHVMEPMPTELASGKHGNYSLNEGKRAKVEIEKMCPQEFHGSLMRSKGRSRVGAVAVSTSSHRGSSEPLSQYWIWSNLTAQ